VGIVFINFPQSLYKVLIILNSHTLQKVLWACHGMHYFYGSNRHALKTSAVHIQFQRIRSYWFVQQDAYRLHWGHPYSRAIAGSAPTARRPGRGIHGMVDGDYVQRWGRTTAQSDNQKLCISKQMRNQRNCSTWLEFLPCLGASHGRSGLANISISSRAGLVLRPSRPFTPILGDRVM